MKIEVVEDDGAITFLVNYDNSSIILARYDKFEFSQLWPKSKLESHAKLLSDRYEKVTSKTIDLDDVKNVIINTIEKCLLKKLDNLTIENERLKSFLLYHVKTLRSIRKHIRTDTAKGLEYIDNELYNITNLNIGDLFKILDSMTIRRKEKEKTSEDN
jgi:hypothetical protein